MIVQCSTMLSHVQHYCVVRALMPLLGGYHVVIHVNLATVTSS